jgi:hypothetical protein
MDLPVLTRVACDGAHQITFQACVLAAATTQRPGAERWTELTVYRTQLGAEEPPAGLYVVARVGRSVLAHKAACTKVSTRGMAPFQEDGADRRVPCRFCLPALDPPAADVVIERTKHALQRARTAADLGDIVFPRRNVAALRGMTADAVAQLRHADPDFDYWWDVAVAPALDWT